MFTIFREYLKRRWPANDKTSDQFEELGEVRVLAHKLHSGTASIHHSGTSGSKRKNAQSAGGSNDKRRKLGTNSCPSHSAEESEDPFQSSALPGENSHIADVDEH